MKFLNFLRACLFLKDFYLETSLSVFSRISGKEKV